MSFINNTLTPAELSAVLELLAAAPTTVGRAAQTHQSVQKLVRLASGKDPIGALVPAEVADGSVADRGPKEA